MHKPSLNYRTKLLLTMLLMVWGPVVCFLFFQHRREQAYKTGELNASLQLLNLQIGAAVEQGERPAAVFEHYRPWFDGLRLTLIDADGRVLYDSWPNHGRRYDNHADRKEIRQALTQGSGFTAMRTSETNNRTYFYSATRYGRRFVRTALPYTPALRSLLHAGAGPLAAVLAIAVLFTIIAFVQTHRLGLTVARLRLFASRLEEGRSVADLEPFPHNEIGEISNHIVQLASRLQQATDDLKREHARALYEMQEKQNIKRRLTANINHELKTPIAAIRGYLETLIEHPETPPEMKQRFVERSFEQTERMEHLMHDVLTLTRLDEGGDRLPRAAVDLNAVIADSLADYETRLRAQGFKVNVDTGREPTRVWGNEGLLRSVFSNLISNALSYSGGNSITIRLKPVTPERLVVIFRDNGRGIPEDHLPHIFERFYRIDRGRSRALGGTGLGLSIVKNAVLFHHGQIEAHNRLEGGLEFTFTLARRPQGDELPPHAEAEA